MSEAKKRSEQHLIDADGVELLKSLLPRQWVLREYRPDYGIDFTVELFNEKAGKKGTYETLGEHIFIQLKSTKKCLIEPLKLYRRGNVEKGAEQLNKDEPYETIDTIRIGLDDAELRTVERMGTGVPVLLVVADILNRRCFFVCLNDYIDKMLVPKKREYLDVGTKRIHIPFANRIGSDLGTVSLRWYGKRAKLYAAFQRIRFQEMELRFTRDPVEFRELALVFAQRLLRYDFWDATEMCPLLGYYATALRSLVEKGEPGLFSLDMDVFRTAAEGDEGYIREMVANEKQGEIITLWERLSLLGRNYEDVWREWFLHHGLEQLPLILQNTFIVQHQPQIRRVRALPLLAKLTIGKIAPKSIRKRHAKPPERSF
jgi:hypothetical protein